MEDIVCYRRELHQIPELGFSLPKTQAYIMDRLKEFGLSPQAISKTGVICDVSGQEPGKMVALRADMDGLPIQEDTGEPFSSNHGGMMHACGHDGHMAILLGVAQQLVKQPCFRGTVRLIFQPSEEKLPGGAPVMIRDGVLEGVSEIFGLHLWSSDEVGTVRLFSGPFMANADDFSIDIRGRGGHGSEPATTQDAVLIASQIVVNLQTIPSRRVNAFDPLIISCGTIEGGTNFNVIAETARITGTVRTLSEDIQSKARQEIIHMAKTTADLYRAQAMVLYQEGYPAVVNHTESVEKWKKALEGLVRYNEADPAMGGEDFAYYLKEIPGAFLFLGARPEGEVFPHHNPHFYINEDALPLGVEVLVRAAMTSLNQD